MTPKDLHAEMSKIIDRPNDPRLKYYRDDFEKLDLRYLENAWHPHARMLWVVRESGTHIVPLGIHPKMTEEGLGILNMADPENAPKEAYLLSTRGVTPLTDRDAQRVLSTFDWKQNRDGRILCNGSPVADIADVVLTRDGNRLYADAKLYPVQAVESLSMGDLVALRIYAERAAISEAQTLFVQTRSVRIGDQDVDSLLDAQREAWLGSVATSPSRPAKNDPQPAQRSFGV